MPTSDPTAALIIRGGLPFLDRQQLRSNVRSLLSAGRSGILIVNGPPRSGKSYTAEFIHHVAAQREDSHVARVTLDPYEASDYEPIDLVADLGAQMGLSAPAPDSDEPPARRHRRLANWLLGHERYRDEDWWWILDGFSAEELPASTRDFLDLVIARIGEGMPVRLILLDFPNVSTAITGWVQHERLDPSGINGMTIDRFFEDLIGALTGGKADVSIAEQATSMSLRASPRTWKMFGFGSWPTA